MARSAGGSRVLGAADSADHRSGAARNRPVAAMTDKSEPEAAAMIDDERALERLLRLLTVDGPAGEEARVRDYIVEELVRIGVPRAAIREDDAAQRIDVPCQSGNLIALLPGTVRGPRRLLSAHMDTVPLARGAEPVRRGDRIVCAGRTALGGDDRTGVAAVLSALDELFRQGLPHPPLAILFTVHEESGVRGSRALRVEELGGAAVGFNFDGRDPAAITIAAIGKVQLDIEVRGVAAHASLHPERGVSAVAIFAAATAELDRQGWLGAIEQPGGAGRSNIGVLRGGEATNVVTDRLYAQAEARSHDRAFLVRIVEAYERAFASAAAARANADGVNGEVEIRARESYRPFRLDADAAVVETAMSAAKRVGLTPHRHVANGGIDASWLAPRGIPTVTMGAGTHRPHTVEEFVVIDEYLSACRLALELATMP